MTLKSRVSIQTAMSPLGLGCSVFFELDIPVDVYLCYVLLGSGELSCLPMSFPWSRVCICGGEILPRLTCEGLSPGDLEKGTLVLPMIIPTLS